MGSPFRIFLREKISSAIVDVAILEGIPVEIVPGMT